MTKNPIDEKVCIRHEEEDFIWLEQRGSCWIRKVEPKHYHVYRGCIITRNSKFDENDIRVSTKETLTKSKKDFLRERLFD